MRNFIVTIEGKQYEVGVEEVGASSAPVAAAPVAAAPVAAPKAAPAASVPANGTKFTAPMPGMIKKLVAKNGATVKEGEVIVVLEAMKMDNDLTAPCSGTITFSVSEGSNVDTGAVIAVIG
ncbi:MAG: acetyl-CoA carboxylase biotin carboxyl carrier protein subunit [Clostridia bacterium]|nr:acetyl-CoA carboxylase biotin carboxyl carrier protein subunit [Clostridia bacterium]